MSDADNLASGLILKTKNPSNTACIKDYLGILSCADNPTAAGRAAAFLSYTSSKVQIEFELICKRLRRRVLESVTRERHGLEGVRILRLLLDTGKMDEKQVGFFLSLWYITLTATADLQSGYGPGKGC